MSKLAGIIGKMAQGAAAVAVPAALEEQRARIEAQRDKTLQSYRQQEQQAGMEHDRSMQGERLTAQAQEGAANRQVTTAEGEANRGVRREELTATLEWQGMQFMQNETDRQDRLKLIEAQLEGIGYDNKLKSLDLANEEDLREARRVLNDPESTEEERRLKAEYINLLNPKEGSFRAVQAKEMGLETDEWVIVDTDTGDIWNAGVPGARPEPSFAGSGGGGGGDFSHLDTPEKIRAATRIPPEKGGIDRATARRLLEEKFPHLAQ